MTITMTILPEGRYDCCVCRSVREGGASVQRTVHRQEEDSSQEENVEPDVQRVVPVRSAAGLLYPGPQLHTHTPQTTQYTCTNTP